MRADHPGSYLHLSQPLRLDARPCTYMWPRKQHDADPGQAAKWVPPSKSEWTRSADGEHFEHGVGGGKSYGPPIVHASPARSPKECRDAPRLGARRLSDASLSRASTVLEIHPPTPSSSIRKD